MASEPITVFHIVLMQLLQLRRTRAENAILSNANGKTERRLHYSWKYMNAFAYLTEEIDGCCVFCFSEHFSKLVVLILLFAAAVFLLFMACTARCWPMWVCTVFNLLPSGLLIVQFPSRTISMRICLCVSTEHSPYIWNSILHRVFFASHEINMALRTYYLSRYQMWKKAFLPYYIRFQHTLTICNYFRANGYFVCSLLQCA